MISSLFIYHLTCHLSFYWFSILLHLQEESSCDPPPPECKDQAFAPERATRDEVSLLLMLSKHRNDSDSFLWYITGFLQLWNKLFCFSWICCMRRRSTPWSIGLGCRRQNMLPTKGTFSTTCRRCNTVICLINRMIQTLPHPSITTQISQCVLRLWRSKSTKT